jgi:S-formylglutathione hydrolase FrmB
MVLTKLFRVLCAAVVVLGGWVGVVGVAPTAAAAGVEYLMVPSAAMGRDIPVAFQGGGPHMVVLLDAFNAAPDVSNWVTAGNAMNTLAGTGLSVAAPAGGAYTMYTNWEANGSKQWETFLADELPNWMAANKGLAPNRHAIVGASQGGTGAVTMATFHPDRYSYAGSLSGFLTPSNTQMIGLISTGINNGGGNDWGTWAGQLGAMAGDIAAVIG